MRLAQRVFPPSRLIEFISQGLSSKNSRTRVECTEALSHILKTKGLAAFERSKEKPFPVIAQVSIFHHIQSVNHFQLVHGAPIVCLADVKLCLSTVRPHKYFHALIWFS